MRNSWTVRLIAIALIGGGSMSALGAISSPVSADASLSGDITVGLNNTTAKEQSCSEVPGLDGAAWHFIAPSGSFVDINFLTVGGTTYNQPDFLSYPTSQHAYVLVPAGKTIGQLEGGQFVVNGTDKVVLSHTCAGTTTTTTTTTTQPETTTTTQPETTTTTQLETTTTTQLETTTTEAVSSPTTTEPATTVSTLSASETPTAPPTTQPLLAVELPATGSSSWTLLLAGLASALGGIGLIRISRRPA